MMLRLLAVLVFALPFSGSSPIQEQQNTAHVRVYPHLDELRTKADQLIEEKRYGATLDLYADAIQKQPHAVVPMSNKVSASTYLGISEYVHRIVAGWPEEGRNAYRRKYDGSARRIFEQAHRTRDLVLLDTLRDRYPFSTWISHSLSLSANILFLDGTPEESIPFLEALLQEKTDLPRAPSIARLAQCYSLTGKTADLHSLRENLSDALRKEIIVEGTKTVPLDSFLESLAGRTRPDRTARTLSAIPSWPMPGGSSSGTGHAQGKGKPGPRTWGIPMPLPTYRRSLNSPGFRSRVPGYNTPDFFPIFPAVANGVLYAHNEYAIYAYDLYSDQARELWNYRLQPPNGDLAFDDRVVHTTSFDRDRVFASLVTSLGDTEVQMGYIPVKFSFPQRTLHAFDASTGAVLWKRGGKKDDPYSFLQAPTPANGLLYVGAVVQKNPTDPFEHHVLCLDPATGKTLWNSFVASGHTEINLFGNPTRESMGSAVVQDGDTLFYCTNLGAAAALDRRTGRILWIVRYEQNPVRPTRNISVNALPLGWINSPPIATHGLFLMTPTDSPTLFAVDQRSGMISWKLPRRLEHRAMFGVQGDNLVIGGAEIEVISISKQGKLLGGFTPRVGRGRGKGVVSTDGIYFSTARGIMHVPADNLNNGEYLPWKHSTGGGGNVLVVDGILIQATNQGVEVTANPRSMAEQILSALSDNPRDPALRYRAALLFLQSGDPHKAMQSLLETVKLHAPGQPEEVRIARMARRRIYTLSLTDFERHRKQRNMTRAEESLKQAREFAPDAASRVEVMFRQADMRIISKDPAGAIAHLQDALQAHATESYRGDPVPDRVQRDIDSIIREYGRNSYTALDLAAKKQLDGTLRHPSPEALRDIVAHYPNSLAAREALRRAAMLYAKQNRADDAVRMMRKFLRDYPDDSEVLTVYSGLITILETKKSHLAAAGILRRMLRLYPEKSFELEGRMVPVKSFVGERLARKEYQRTRSTEARATLTPPMKKVARYADPDFPEGTPLLVRKLPSSTAAELLFLNYGRAIKAFDLNANSLSWTVRLSSTCRYAAYFDEGLLLCTDREIIRVNVPTGKIEWTHQPQATLRGFCIADHLLIYQSVSLRSGVPFVSAIDAAESQLVWKQNFDGIPRSPVYDAGATVVFTTTSPNRIYTIDLETGRRLAARAPHSTRAPIHFSHVSPQVAIAHVSNQFLQAYDTSTARILWQISLAHYHTELVEIQDDGIFLLAMRPGAKDLSNRFMAWINIKTGKIDKAEDLDSLGDPRFVRIDEKNIYVLTRHEAQRTLHLHTFDRNSFQQTHKVDIGEAHATLTPPLMTTGHLLIPVFEMNDNRDFRFSTTMVEKSGKVVQNIRSGYEFKRPPATSVSGESLLFSVDNIVEVYK